jgi:type I restriction enzyme, R subunit
LDAAALLAEELERLRLELAEHRSAAELARADAEAAARARGSAEETASREAEERAAWEQLAQQAEDAKLALARQLAALQAAAQRTPPRERADTIRRAEEAAVAIYLDEASTREIIDRQLRERGWTVDSKTLRHGSGTRPVRGRATAICRMADRKRSCRLCPLHRHRANCRGGGQTPQ